MIPRKKLIEVALPLEAINIASAREKSIRHGHPSTLHLWWARRPLAAARAVIFAQIVDDPSSHPERFPTEEAQEKERQRLFKLVEQLVLWENTKNEKVLDEARQEIWKNWRATCAENQNHPHAKELFDVETLPTFHDPFAGGGTLPLEAQRLGLEVHASDLNPVAVLINKAMIEIPPRFAGNPPVNPESRKDSRLIEREWHGAQALAEDVRYYGRWLRDEAEKRIGHLYQTIEITTEMTRERPDLKPYEGKRLAVIAWLWTRTVKSPNPAFAGVDVPLSSSFLLGTKAGKEAYIEPRVENGQYSFRVKSGKPQDPEKAKNGTKAGSKGGFRCVLSDVPIPFQYIRDEASAGRMSERLAAIVAEGERERVYLTPTKELEASARGAQPTWLPSTETLGKCRVNIGLYGMITWDKLFTPRQLVALTTFADLVVEARERVRGDAIAAGLPDDDRSLEANGAGATAYAEAIAVYLGIAVSRHSNAASTLCTWNPGEKKEDIRFTFSRQALAMTWDFAEGNPFSNSSGNLADSYETWVYKALMWLPWRAVPGASHQVDAATQTLSANSIVSTDPPYYDNIGYADLSDFFYVWLRRGLRPIIPDLFATLAVPKAEELVATPYRHGTKEKAEAFFLDGMTQAMHRLEYQVHPAFPVTIYYAFRQSETENDGEGGTASTGWDTFLEAVIRAGFAITGTWPMRTEREARSIGIGANALASSIVLVCRPHAADASTTTRRDFVAALKRELPGALTHLQRSNIAPVDLAQAAIGPGMAVYTRYAKVIDAAGMHLSVREALTLINQTLDEVLAEQEGDFDADSRWAVAWFEQSGFADGDYGVAEMLSKAKNTSVSGMVDAGIVASKSGKVRLLRPDELPANWDPETDARLTAWESVHQLVRALEAGGENAAAGLVRKLGGEAEIARELAYRLYTVSERKKRAQEALSYNGLVQSWPEITRLARSGAQGAQTQLFSQEE